MNNYRECCDICKHPDRKEPRRWEYPHIDDTIIMWTI